MFRRGSHRASARPVARSDAPPPPGSGRVDSPPGFDFSAAMRALCSDVVTRLPELRHIDLARVAIGFSRTRRNVSHGLQASLTPLRFEGGASEGLIKGRRYACQRVVDEAGRDYLYILSFYLPRFLNQPFEEKLSTVLHELWHVSPAFDGDLRRHEGRCYAHGPSQGAYDAHMDGLSRQWLTLDPPPHLYGFLELTFEQLAAEYGGVYGTRIATPKLVPVECRCQGSSQH